jgi:hypothetical protein
MATRTLKNSALEALRSLTNFSLTGYPMAGFIFLAWCLLFIRELWRDRSVTLVLKTFLMIFWVRHLVQTLRKRDQKFTPQLRLEYLKAFNSCSSPETDLSFNMESLRSANALTCLFILLSLLDATFPGIVRCLFENNPHYRLDELTLANLPGVYKDILCPGVSLSSHELDPMLCSCSHCNGEQSNLKCVILLLGSTSSMISSILGHSYEIPWPSDMPYRELLLEYVDSMDRTYFDSQCMIQVGSSLKTFYSPVIDVIKHELAMWVVTPVVHEDVRMIQHFLLVFSPTPILKSFLIKRLCRYILFAVSGLGVMSELLAVQRLNFSGQLSTTPSVLDLAFRSGCGLFGG